MAESKPHLRFDLRVSRDDFTLDAAGAFADDITAIFGPSGAGKSTLLGSIAGSIKPDSGEIEIFDGNESLLLFSSDLGENLAPDKRRIGMVFQDGALFPHMTVAENLAFPLEVRKMSKEERKRRIDNIRC